MKINELTKIEIIGGVVVFACLIYIINRSTNAVSNAAAAVGTAINPADQNNLANRGVNAVVKGVTGQDITLGTKIGDWLDSITGTAYDPNKPTMKQPGLK